MSALTAYDLKQIGLIEKKISLFENYKLDLFDLIGDLVGLLNALESVTVSWKDDFQAEINTLEIIHDSIEDGSISRWKGNYKEDIYNAILKLKKLTVSVLEEYLEKSDPNVLECAIVESSNWFICPKCNDAWESDSFRAMVICPKCESAFHNPRASNVKTTKK